MKRKLPYIFIPVVFIVFCVILYFYRVPAPEIGSAHAKCPEDYAETDAGTTEYRNALIDWTSSYFEANPKATMSDWSMAKSQLWKDNNCAVALERSKLSGEVMNLKPWEKVDYAVQNAIQEATKLPN